MSWRVAIGGLPDSLRNPTVCHSESVSVAACCRCVPPPPRPSEPHTPSLAAHHSRSLCTSSKLPTHACLGDQDELVDDQWWAARLSTPSYRVPPCLWPHVVAVCHHHRDHLEAPHAFSCCLIILAHCALPTHACLGARMSCWVASGMLPGPLQRWPPLIVLGDHRYDFVGGPTCLLLLLGFTAVHSRSLSHLHLLGQPG